MKEFLIGMGGAVVGSVLFMIGNFGFYIWESNKRAKTMKNLEKSVIDALRTKFQIEGDKPASNAKVYPFKAPTPPNKIN